MLSQQARRSAPPLGGHLTLQPLDHSLSSSPLAALMGIIFFLPAAFFKFVGALLQR